MGDNEQVRKYRDAGVVLGTHKLGEADRIVTILTRGNGVVRAVAKGVRRTSSRFGSRLEPLMMIDLQANRGRNLDVVTQVELIEPFAQGLISDYDYYTAGSVMAETALRLTEDDPHTEDQFLLLVAALRSMCRREHPARSSLDAYLIRAMSLAGWAPSLIDCARCGAPGPHRAFSLEAGGAVCRACRRGGEHLPGPDALAYLHRISTADWPEPGTVADYDVQAASKVVTAFVQWHLERRVKSLALLER